MLQPTDVANVCCVAIELNKSSWVIAFSPPADGGRASVHQIAAKDIDEYQDHREVMQRVQILLGASSIASPRV